MPPVVMQSAAGRVRNTGQSVVQEIIQEATAANSDTNHPLPLVATWITGSIWDEPDDPPVGYSPHWQMEQVLAGRHMIPCFNHPNWWMLDPALTGNGSMRWTAYYQNPIQQAAALGLPLCFVGTQWESYLYTESEWFDLPYADNPNMAHATTGAPSTRLSAFGAIPPWEEVGAKVMGALNQSDDPSMLSIIQGWYPNPPAVFWISNNEPNLEKWNATAGNWVDEDKHYLDLYAAGASAANRKQRVADGLIARYTAMHDAMRAAQPSGAWRDGSKFIGYEAFGPNAFARWNAWDNYALNVPNRIDPNPLMWDGGSPSLYNRWSGWDDYVESPQYQGNNWPFMLAEALTLNDDFWFELSTWSGIDYFPLASTPPGDSEGQSIITHSPGYTPARYGGMAQYGMWLMRPRCVRVYINSGSLLEDSEDYFNVVADAVDKVYSTAALETFWRQSTLVENTGRAHLYQYGVPTEYASVVRSYQLTTDLDPSGGDPDFWLGDTVLPVYAIARVRGETPNRTFLLYGHAPNGPTSATVTIPGYGDTTQTFTVGGSYFLATEGGSVTAVT